MLQDVQFVTSTEQTVNNKFLPVMTIAELHNVCYESDLGKLATLQNNQYYYNGVLIKNIKRLDNNDYLVIYDDYYCDYISASMLVTQKITLEQLYNAFYSFDSVLLQYAFIVGCNHDTPIKNIKHSTRKNYMDVVFADYSIHTYRKTVFVELLR